MVVHDKVMTRDTRCYTPLRQVQKRELVPTQCNFSYERTERDLNMVGNMHCIAVVLLSLATLPWSSRPTFQRRDCSIVHIT